MKRRDFIAKVGLAGALATAALSAPAVHAQQRFSWRMVTAWSPRLDILQGAAVRFAKLCESMSRGALKIEVYAGGELVPAFGVFDAVSQRTVELGHSGSYYWAGKVPALQWFTSVPYGLNAQGMNAWMYSGGGIQLWEEVYKPYNIVPRPMGSVGSQMAGWYRKKITSIADFKGLKMRIPGLGGRILARAGSTVVLTPMGEIFAALERGVIDAAEMIGPYDDLRMGLHRSARYYYYPAWHEPGTMTELIINTKAWESLSSDLKAVVEAAAAEVGIWTLSEYNVRTAKAVAELKTKYTDQVELAPLPPDVLKALHEHTKEVIAEEAAKDPVSRKVNEAFTKFKAFYYQWEAISEDPYYRYLAS